MRRAAIFHVVGMEPSRMEEVKKAELDDETMMWWCLG